MAGGGIEYKFNPSWAVKAEYQFISLERGDDYRTLNYSTDGRSEVNTFRVGVNYFLNGDYNPLK